MMMWCRSRMWNRSVAVWPWKLSSWPWSFIVMSEINSRVEVWRKTAKYTALSQLGDRLGPSSFFEKRGSQVMKEVLTFGQVGWKGQEHHAVTGWSWAEQFLAILFKEIFTAKKVIEDMMDVLPRKDELGTIKWNVAYFEESLAEA